MVCVCTEVCSLKDISKKDMSVTDIDRKLCLTLCLCRLKSHTLP